ncbi:MAG: hypothetical protein Pars2KO_24820 [Parasphingorhabdus sp.]
MDAIDVKEPHLRDPLRYFDSTKLSALFEASSKELGTYDLVSQIANKMVPKGFSDAGFLSMFEPSFGIALQKAILAQRLGESLPVLRLHNDQLGDYIIWEESSCQSRKIMYLGFTVIVESLRSLSEDALFDVRNISFTHSKPKDVDSEYLKMGDNVQIPILYDQPQSRIEFRRGFFDIANPNCNVSLILASHEQRSQKRWQNRPYAVSCYNYLIYLLDKPGPNLDSAAATFSMAERTLRRKLVAEGTSFREILEWVRRDVCQLYFLEGKRQLSDISTLLGYSELSAFTRAYTGWYGHPPSKDASAHAKIAA